MRSKAMFLLVSACGVPGLAIAQVAAVALPESLSLSLAIGPSAGALTPFVVPETGAGATVAPLAAGPYAFLAFELAGRLDLHRFDPARPRRVATDDGLVRVVLPGEVSVFHYRRGGSTFGYLAIGPDGAPRVLIELPGTGVGGTTDPFLPRVAGSRDGTLVAVATTDAAGGDVWRIRVGGAAVNLGGTAPLDVDPESLTFANGTLFFTGSDQFLYRASTSGAVPAALVPLPPSGGVTPVDVQPEIAVSDDGSTVALVAGASELAADVYVVSPPGAAAVNLTQAPAEIEPVGYAPGVAFGPTLALSPDGTAVAYLEQIAGHNELFVRSRAGGPATHVTGDALFDVSIDHVIVIAFVSPTDLAFGAGGDATQIDVYGTSTSAPLTVANLTATSGSLVPPFPNAATLAVTDAFALPAGSTRVVVSASPAGFEARFVDPVSGTSTLALSGQAWPGGGTGPAGGRVFVETIGTGGFPTVVSLTGGAPPSAQTLLSIPAGLAIDSLTPHRAGTEIAFVASGGPGLDLVATVAVPAGSVSLLDSNPLPCSRSLAYSPSGVLGFGLGTGPTLFALRGPSGFVVPAVPVGTGAYLR